MDTSQSVTQRVVVLIQENKTVDFLFPSLAAWGAEVQPYGAPLPTAPAHDQPHDRNAWVHYAMGDYPAERLSVDDEALVPLYSWLAKEHTFCDRHFGAGSNSTSGHLLCFCGQTPTFKNPPFGGAHPVWNLPTVFGLAQRAGVSWGAFVDQDQYPAKLVAELSSAPLAAHVHGPGTFLSMAAAGTLPELSYVWSPAGYDEHPPFSTPADPGYLAKGHDLKWQEIDAVVAAGHWDDTAFLLTYDDWGGYADHVACPDIETLPDQLHPGGFQAIGGSRIPLIMFGGHVVQGVESQWHSHASIAKTAIDLLGLPPLGVPRVDNAPSLAARVDPQLHRPPPPRHGTTIVQPTPPTPRPMPTPPGPWPGPLGQPMPPLVTNTAATLPAPTDGVVHAKPPPPPA